MVTTLSRLFFVSALLITAMLQALPTLEFATDIVEVNELDRTTLLPLALSTNSDAGVRFQLLVTGGTAQSPDDFAFNSGESATHFALRRTENLRSSKFFL